MTSSQIRETNWGRWGTEDERGALNLITPEAVVGGAGAVRRGRVYPLGLHIDATHAPIIDGRGEPRRLTLTSDSDNERYAAFGAAEGVGANQDVLILASHHGTHMDALSHVFAENEMYNGFRSSTFKSFSGADKLGIEKVGVVAGRGMLLDIAAHVGVDVLPDGYNITGEELEACAAREGVEVRSGDIMLVRTGWLENWQRVISAGGETGFGQPGIGLSGAEFVRDREIAAVGADNGAVEVIPFDGDEFLSVHIMLLVKLGVHLFEHLSLGQLAADGVHEFLFVACPLPVIGAAGSPINPVAIA
jgi:kynurenine formamidase